MEIWEPKPPGTLWAIPGLLRDSCTIQATFNYFKQLNSHVKHFAVITDKEVRLKNIGQLHIY